MIRVTERRRVHHDGEDARRILTLVPPNCSCAIPDCTRIGTVPETLFPVSLHDCWREGRFTGTIWQRRPEGLFSLVVMHASRFRNCVYAERDRIGGERKKRGSQKTRATLRREVHEPQEVLQACGAQSVSWPLKLHLRAAPRPGCPQSGMF